eukprot:8516393-Lingulodinium_polyedra.AAC.1
MQRTPSSWQPTPDLALRPFRKLGHGTTSRGAAERACSPGSRGCWLACMRPACGTTWTSGAVRTCWRG